MLFFGEILLPGGFLVCLFEFLLPFLDLLKLSLVVEINLLELLLEALVHHLKVGVFDALACVAGELFDFGHDFGHFFLLLKEIIHLIAVTTHSTCSFWLIIRLACEGLVFLVELVKHLFLCLDDSRIQKSHLCSFPIDSKRGAYLSDLGRDLIHRFKRVHGYCCVPFLVSINLFLLVFSCFSQNTISTKPDFCLCNSFVCYNVVIHVSRKLFILFSRSFPLQEHAYSQ